MCCRIRIARISHGALQDMRLYDVAVYMFACQLVALNY